MSPDVTGPPPPAAPVATKAARPPVGPATPPASPEPPTPTPALPPNTEPIASATLTQTLYPSEEFGYSVEFEDPWTVASTDVQPGLDVLVLDSGGSVLDFIGARRPWTAPQCIDQLYDTWLRGRPNLRSVTPHTGIDAGAYLRTEAEAVEVWDVTFADGAGGVLEETIYARCLVLEPGAVLLTTQEAPRATYPVEAALREAVYDGLTLP